MATTITPTRFGLKYAPIPTLSLEYEEDLGVIDDETGVRSLYVFKESQGKSDKRPRIRKKIHVVELPQLTGQSEPHEIARQLQRENQRFLGPNVVKEQQLRRLLQQLVDHLRTADLGKAPRRTPQAAMAEAEDDALENSTMEESAAEASASLEVEEPAPQSKAATNKVVKTDDDEGLEPSNRRVPPTAAAQQPPSSTNEDEDDDAEEDAEEDAKKKQALKSESDGSDDEDVQSEELEYFSEDGSDEDSF